MNIEINISAALIAVLDVMVMVMCVIIHNCLDFTSGVQYLNLILVLILVLVFTC